MAKVLDCDIKVSELKLQLRCCVHLYPYYTNHLGKVLNLFIPPLLFFFEDNFYIKWSHKTKKLNQTIKNIYMLIDFEIVLFSNLFVMYYNKLGGAVPVTLSC